MSRVALSIVLLCNLVVTGSVTMPPGRCYEPPVRGRIVEPFRAPPCPYCAGHRGVDFDGQAGEPVRAAAAGVVSFAGNVAGTSYLVIGHDDGLRATYGRIRSGRVRVGQRVQAGQVLGVTGPEGLYFGLREGVRYVDPQPFLGRRRAPVRLVPLDGEARPRVGASRLVCPVQGGSR